MKNLKEILNYFVITSSIVFFLGLSEVTVFAGPADFNSEEFLSSLSNRFQAPAPNLESSESIQNFLEKVAVPKMKASQSDAELWTYIESAHALIKILKNNGTFKVNVSENEFKGIKWISNLIEDLCPVESCIVIGLGRSPAPFTSYLRTKHAKYAWNIPLSKFQHTGKDGHESLSPENVEKLFEHFDHYFPQDVGQKKVVLIDYSQTGLSLVAAKGYLQDYLKRKWGDTEPEVTAVGITSSDAATKVAPKVDIQIQIDNSKVCPSTIVLHKLEKQKYDHVAEYGKFVLPHDSSPIVENSKFAHFYLEMAEWNHIDSKYARPYPVVDSGIKVLHGIDLDSEEGQLRKIYHLGYTRRANFAQIILPYLDPEVSSEAFRVAATNAIINASQASFSRDGSDAKYLLPIYRRVLRDPSFKVRSKPLYALSDGRLSVNSWSRRLVREALLEANAVPESQLSFYQCADNYLDAAKYMGLSSEENMSIGRQLLDSENPIRQLLGDALLKFEEYRRSYLQSPCPHRK